MKCLKILSNSYHFPLLFPFYFIGPYLASQPLDSSLLCQPNLAPPVSQAAPTQPLSTANTGNPSTPSSLTPAPSTNSSTTPSSSLPSTATPSLAAPANGTSSLQGNKNTSFPPYGSMNNATNAVPTQVSSVQNSQAGQQQQNLQQATGMSSEQAAAAVAASEVTER